MSLVLLSALLFSQPCWGVVDPGGLEERIGLDQKLGEQIDLTLTFRDQFDQEQTLGSLLLPQRPFLLVPVFYRCPRLCGLAVNGLVDAVNKLTLELGQDYQILTVSFDPNDTAGMASDRAQRYYSKLSALPEQPDRSWRFLTGRAAQIQALMDQIGFRYKKEGESFAHSAVVVVGTPTGKISRYFPGIQFSPRDIRLALLEAGRGRIGSIVDAILMYCFRFDPQKGKYTWAVFGLLKIFGTLVLAALSALIFLLWKADRARKQSFEGKV